MLMCADITMKPSACSKLVGAMKRNVKTLYFRIKPRVENSVAGCSGWAGTGSRQAAAGCPWSVSVMPSDSRLVQRGEAPVWTRPGEAMGSRQGCVRKRIGAGQAWPLSRQDDAAQEAVGGELAGRPCAAGIGVLVRRACAQACWAGVWAAGVVVPRRRLTPKDSQHGGEDRCRRRRRRARARPIGAAGGRVKPSAGRPMAGGPSGPRWLQARRAFVAFTTESVTAV